MYYRALFYFVSTQNIVEYCTITYYYYYHALPWIDFIIFSDQASHVYKTLLYQARTRTQTHRHTKHRQDEDGQGKEESFSKQTKTTDVGM